MKLKPVHDHQQHAALSPRIDQFFRTGLFALYRMVVSHAMATGDAQSQSDYLTKLIDGKGWCLPTQADEPRSSLNEPHIQL